MTPIQVIAQIRGGNADSVQNALLSQMQAVQGPGGKQANAHGITLPSGAILHSPSNSSYNSRVSYEIIARGKIGETVSDTQAAVVRFSLSNPGEEPITFNYTVVSGSFDSHEDMLSGDTSGTITLTQDVPQVEVTITIATFADKPAGGLPNKPNTFWTGEHYFYLYCSDIQNALFQGDRMSLTVPVPVDSIFDYEAAYANAVNTTLIDFNTVPGGNDGVYILPEEPGEAGDPEDPEEYEDPDIPEEPRNRQLMITAQISGDVRKMIDDGVFTHIRLPQGYFMNTSHVEQTIEYQVKAWFNNGEERTREAWMGKQQPYTLEPTSKTSFYSESFSQCIPINEINLGPDVEGNGLFNELDFDFRSPGLINPEDLLVSFTDEEGYYLRHQVSFSDQAAPQVKGVSKGLDQAYYGDEVPIIIEFTEPVHTDAIIFTVGGQTLQPMESAGTISQRVSFLYPIGDEALNATNVFIEVSDITGAVDLSGKAMEASGESGTYVDISHDLSYVFAYCAVPEVSLDQGTSPNMTANVSIDLKLDDWLSNWLIDVSHVGGENVSTVVKARAVTAEGSVDVPLTIQTDETRVTGLTGSFTAPKNETGDYEYYALEICFDAGSGFKPYESLVTYYAVQPLILVKNESDVTLEHLFWPMSNQILIDAGGSLAMDYHLNVNAAWIGSEYFTWSSSNSSVAAIDANGNITLTGVGQVYFTLTVTNPLNDDAVTFNSRTLTVIEAAGAYLYVPNGVKFQDLQAGSSAKISFSTNMTERNELYGGSGTETDYTFKLYEVTYTGDAMIKGSVVSAESASATQQSQLNSYTVPGSLLTRATERGKYGYILEISAIDLHTGNTMIAEAYIRIRQQPARAVLTRPESVFLLDSANSFSVAFAIENKTADTQYELVVTKNSNAAPVISVSSPAPIGLVTVPVNNVGDSRLLDVYTVSLMARNPSDDAWSYDSYSVYVYNHAAMKILINGLMPPMGAVTMGPQLDDGEILEDIDFLSNRYLFGIEFYRSVKVDDRTYAWSAIADRVTWSVEGESVYLTYEGKRINSENNPVLLPGTALLLQTHGFGSSVVTATHTLTGMSKSVTFNVNPLKNKLYLFRVYPGATCQMVYINGDGQTKRITFTDEVGVYEEKGIISDVEFYPVEGSENIYDFTVIPSKTLVANQNSQSGSDLYPVTTVKLPRINYNVSLELFDQSTGDPYTGDLIIRGGVYFNDIYQDETTINGQMGNSDITVSANSRGQYTLAFNPSDFTNRLTATDRLRYVIEVNFADSSHLPKYIAIENDAIQDQKGSPLGVCLTEGIEPLKASAIQNGAIVVSHRLTINGEEMPINKKIGLDEVPESAVLDMTVIVPDATQSYGINWMFGSTGNYLMPSPSKGEFVRAYPFSDYVTLNFNVDFREPIQQVLKYLRTGDIDQFYPVIHYYSALDTPWRLQLSDYIEIQDLENIPSMDDLYWTQRPGYGYPGPLLRLEDEFNYGIVAMNGDMDLDGVDKTVKDALEMMDLYRVRGTSNIGLEIMATDDPLVFRGIIRFAAGEYSTGNPSGIFLAGNDKKKFKYMPGFSDMKAMAKGEFLKKAKEQMNKSRGSTKTFGGGAYIECDIYYDLNAREWKLCMLYGDFYLGGGNIFYTDYNGWIYFIPVTSTFEFRMTGEIGMTFLNSRKRDYTAYIPRLQAAFTIYGFAGVGWEYRFTSFKAGAYGMVTHRKSTNGIPDNYGLKLDGQQLSILGEVGLSYKIKLGPLWYEDKYVLYDDEESWSFNQYNKIQQIIKSHKDELSGRMSIIPGKLLGKTGASMLTLVPIEESLTFEDRSYLEAYERYWGTPAAGRRMLALMSSDDLTTIWANAYPFAEPKLSDDGAMMVYLSDMGSTDVSDTSVVYAVRDGGGVFSEEGTVIDASEYPDSSPFVSGTKDGASAVWVRSFAEVNGEAGSEATIEDMMNGLAASEVMAGVYKDGAFITTQLTDNDTPDLAPVTATNGEKAIAVWRSVTLGDLDDPFDFTSDYIMYAIYDGAAWHEAECLYDGSSEKVQVVNTAMLHDGNAAIVYQVVDAGGDSEIICAVIDASGEVVRTLRLTENETDDANPQITTAEFPDGISRFVIGWHAETDYARSTVLLTAVNADGTLYPELSLGISDGMSNYSNFTFTKGVSRLEDLSIIWSQPNDADEDGTYAHDIYGAKLLVSDENTVSSSGKQKLLALEEGRTLDFMDTRVDPSAGVLDFVLLLTEESGQSTLASATAEYKNAITAESDFSYADLLPGLIMPVLFTVRNDGVDTVTGLTIALGGESIVLNSEALASGDAKNYLASYDVPEAIVDAPYTITARYASGDTYTHTGTLKLSTPDVGIYQINSTNESQRERGFRVLLQNTAYADLKSGTHDVTLEIWDQLEFPEGSPLKTIAISEAEFDTLNDSLLTVSVVLDEEDLALLLDERGELPEGGVRLLFRTVLTEDWEVIEDADISNDIGYATIYSLMDRRGSAVTLASLTQTADGRTIVDVEAFNNSMQAIDNGNIVVTLRDSSGNALETQQTYILGDGSSLIGIPGEGSHSASLSFSQAGYTADVTFARVSEESTFLSVLSLRGIANDFDPEVTEYDLEVYDLTDTIITVIPENPEATVSVTKNNVPVSISGPIPMAYGTTVFGITVTSGEAQTTYTVRVVNSRWGSNPGGSTGNNDPGSQLAELTIGGIKQSLSIIRRGENAVVSLSNVAQTLFSGNKDVLLTLPAIPGASGYTMEIPADVLAGFNSTAGITVSTPFGSIRIPGGMLAGMDDLEGKTAGITIGRVDTSILPKEVQEAIGNRPVISLTLTLDGIPVSWNNPDAPVTVRIPYTPTAEELENPEGIVIWYIDGSGRAVSVHNGRYDPATGTVTFSTTHFSLYAVVYHLEPFRDVPEHAWFYKAVSFIAARGITSGTGNGRFSPEATLTRGEFIVLLMRALGIQPDENPKDNFADAGNAYYTGYLAAAKRLGISAGVGSNLFGPDLPITRQQMFTLLYNALKVTNRLPDMDDGSGLMKSLSDFADADQIASWAVDAMTFLVEAGIINGNNGKLLPDEMTTRAQMASVLYHILTR